MVNNGFNSRGNSSQNKGFSRNRGFDGSKSFGRDGRKINSSSKFERKDSFSDNRKNTKFSKDNSRFDKNDNQKNRYSKDNNKSFKQNNKFGSHNDKNTRYEDRKNKNEYSKTKRGQGFKKEYDKSFNKEDRYENKHINEPHIPAEIEINELDSSARSQLRGLRKEVADKVAKHLIMAGKLIDFDPQVAFEHANFALKCASRVPIVREAVALCAYQCEDYTQALREIRAYERLTGKKTLPSIEADSLRATGKINQAIELISNLNMKSLDISEQVEVIIVSASIRHDMNQGQIGIDILDNTIKNPSIKDDLEYRLLEAKANLLEKMGEIEKAQEILQTLPENEEIDIYDLDELEIEEENTTGLGGSDIPLSKLYDLALFDLDGVCFRGAEPVNNAAQGINEVRKDGMFVRFVTNNASKTPKQVTEKLQSFEIEANEQEVITAAMDIAGVMSEQLSSNAKVLVVGGKGLREAVINAGFEIVDSYDKEPEAVVQGLDSTIGWEELTQAAYSIENGATFYASNIDSTLPTEHGMALGNGSLVAAVQHATGKKPIAGGKPFPGIYKRSVQTCPEAKYPIAIGDRLGTDIAGANAANYPSMHVLTGVNDARDVAFASIENRPTYLALDITGLTQPHPYPTIDENGYFSCENSSKVKVTDKGLVDIDGNILDEETTITLNTYRSYVAAIWDAKDNRNIRVDSPKINVIAD